MSAAAKMTTIRMANIGSTILSEISIVSMAMTSTATKKASIKTRQSVIQTSHNDGKATCSATTPVSAIKFAIVNRKRRRLRFVKDGSFMFTSWRGWKTATFTGPRRKSLFSKPTRPAAPCATYCYHAIACRFFWLKVFIDFAGFQ